MTSGNITAARALSPKVVCWVVLVLGFAVLFPVQRQIDKEQGVYAKIADVLYIPAGTNLRRFSLGNEGLLADIYWTRAVQYFGRRHMENAGGRYELLAPLLRIATDLDPHLLIAYRFGTIFLMGNSQGGLGQPEAALQLLRRGIVANPDYWRLWQDLGFVYYWELKDYKTAAKIFRVGSERPGAAYWMKALAGSIALKGGDLETSRFLWSEIYRTAETDAVRQDAKDHLDSLRSLVDIQKLNQLLDRYRAKTGRAARSFDELSAAGFLRGIPRDPSGTPYVIGADGRAAFGQGSRIGLMPIP